MRRSSIKFFPSRRQTEKLLSRRRSIDCTRSHRTRPWRPLCSVLPTSRSQHSRNTFPTSSKLRSRRLSSLLWNPPKKIGLWPRWGGGVEKARDCDSRGKRLRNEFAVKALLAPGVEYYSDEFAAFDAKGRLHPCPRRLGLRGEQGHPTSVTANDLGAKTGTRPLALNLVVVTSYKQAAV